MLWFKDIWSTWFKDMIYLVYRYDLPGLRIWSTNFLHSAEISVFGQNQADRILKPERGNIQKISKIMV